MIFDESRKHSYYMQSSLCIIIIVVTVQSKNYIMPLFKLATSPLQPLIFGPSVTVTIMDRFHCYTLMSLQLLGTVCVGRNPIT